MAGSLQMPGWALFTGLPRPLEACFPLPTVQFAPLFLPAGMHANIAALKEREPESAALARYTEIAGIVTNDPQAAAEAGADWVARLVHDLAIPRLRSHGIEARTSPARRKDRCREQYESQPDRPEPGGAYFNSAASLVAFPVIFSASAPLPSGSPDREAPFSDMNLCATPGLHSHSGAHVLPR